MDSVHSSERIAEQRVVLRSVSWATYQALADESDHAAGRITYDQGVMELMSPSMAHEHAAALLGRFVEQYSLVRDIELRTVKSTTFRRQDLRRGFEADEAYYIQNAPRMRDRCEVDLPLDPPPDLVIEIDLSRSSIDKLGILAAMGVPEVWRYDDQTLWCGVLDGDHFAETGESVVLAGFPLKLAERLLARRSSESETHLVREFVQRLS